MSRGKGTSGSGAAGGQQGQEGLAGAGDQHIAPGPAPSASSPSPSPLKHGIAAGHGLTQSLIHYVFGFD